MGRDAKIQALEKDIETVRNEVKASQEIQVEERTTWLAVIFLAVDSRKNSRTIFDDAKLKWNSSNERTVNSRKSSIDTKVKLAISQDFLLAPVNPTPK